MSTIKSFFENLSWRIKNENDLSDITWALCEASEEFKRTFLTFFFGEDKYNWNRIVEFQREYARQDSRPDFYFKNNGLEYIIEVKINDRNQHFEQYNKQETFANARKGYITNYRLTTEYDGYLLKTWEDFSKYLRTINNDIDIDLLDGYILYLKNVCAIKDIKLMNLKGIESLYHFINAIDKIIESDTKNYTLTRYTQTNKSSDIRQGRCFHLTFKNTAIEEVWGWIGLYFNNQTILCVEFDKNKGWGLPVFNILDSCKNHKEGNYMSEPYKEDDAYYFELKKTRLDDFENADSVDTQLDILRSFLEEVLLYIESIQFVQL